MGGDGEAAAGSCRRAVPLPASLRFPSGSKPQEAPRRPTNLSSAQFLQDNSPATANNTMVCQSRWAAAAAASAAATAAAAAACQPLALTLHAHAQPHLGRRRQPVSLVAGAGPAGILAAVHLARRGHEMHIFDKRPFPLEANGSDDRAFFILLHPRGHRALLEAGIDLHAAAATPGSGLQPVGALGVGSGRQLLQRRVAYSEPKLLGHRHAFVKAIVQCAQQQQLPNLHWHWSTAFESLDLASRTASFSTGHGGTGSSSSGSVASGGSSLGIAPATPGGSTASLGSLCSSSGDEGSKPMIQMQYDLLVAADGGWSRVRRAAAQQAPELQATAEAARMRYKVVRWLLPSTDCPFSSGGDTSCHSSASGGASDGASGADKEAVGLLMIVPATQAGIMFLSAAADGSGRVEAAVALSSQQVGAGGEREVGIPLPGL